MTEFRPTRFQILPPVIKNLLIINALVFFAQNTEAVTSRINLDAVFALHTWQSELFKPWQLVTHMFMHGGFDHIFANMFALWMFGSILEGLWGSKRFLMFYLVCGFGAALFHLTALYIGNQQLINQFNVAESFESVKHFIDKNVTSSSYFGQPYSKETAYRILQDHLNEATIGASGAVFGCLAAFGYLFPNTKLYIYFFIPLKAKWFVLLYAAFELTMAMRNSAGDNVAHIAHLGGAVVGFALVYFWNKTNRKKFY